MAYYNHLMELLRTKSELRDTARGILKQVEWWSTDAAAGGVLGGPIGAVIGGIVGSAVEYQMNNEYQSLIDALEDLSQAKK